MALVSEGQAEGRLGVAELEDKVYSISDLSREFNITLRALRFYEDKNLLHPQRRGVTRLYSGADRVRLQMILKGKRLGFTLSEIYEMLAAAPMTQEPGAVALALNTAQILTQIDHLERQRVDLDKAILELRATHSRLSGAAGHHAA